MKREHGGVLLYAVLSLVLAASLGTALSALVIPVQTAGLDTHAQGAADCAARSYRNILKGEIASGGVLSALAKMHGRTVALPDGTTVTGTFSLSWIPTDENGALLEYCEGMPTPLHLVNSNGSGLSSDKKFQLIDADMNRYTYSRGTITKAGSGTGSSSSQGLPKSTSMHVMLSSTASTYGNTISLSSGNTVVGIANAGQASSAYGMKVDDFRLLAPESYGLVELVVRKAAALKHNNSKRGSFIYRSRAAEAGHADAMFTGVDFVDGEEGQDVFDDAGNGGASATGSNLETAAYDIVLGKSVSGELSIALPSGGTVVRPLHLNILTQFKGVQEQEKVEGIKAFREFLNDMAKGRTDKANWYTKETDTTQVKYTGGYWNDNTGSTNYWRFHINPLDAILWSTLENGIQIKYSGKQDVTNELKYDANFSADVASGVKFYEPLIFSFGYYKYFSKQPDSNSTTFESSKNVEYFCNWYHNCNARYTYYYRMNGSARQYLYYYDSSKSTYYTYEGGPEENSSTGSYDPVPGYEFSFSSEGHADALIDEINCHSAEGNHVIAHSVSERAQNIKAIEELFAGYFDTYFEKQTAGNGYAYVKSAFYIRDVVTKSTDWATWGQAIHSCTLVDKYDREIQDATGVLGQD